MVKRYVGGLISATTPSVGALSASGIWNPSEQLRYKQSGVWPRMGFIKTGTTSYDLTGYGSYVHVDNLLTDLGTGLLSTMPDTGFLRYTIKTGASTTKDITVSYTKTGTTNFTQSAFSLLGQTLAYTSTISSILLYGMDDHDSLGMDADGKGVLNRGNNNTFVGNWDKFQGTTEVKVNMTPDDVFQFAPSSFLGANAVTLISFPKTESAVWLNLSLSTYRTNSFNGTAMPGALSSAAGTAAPTNALYSISDGVNSFIVGRYGSTTAAYCTVDLSTGVITATALTVTAPSQANGTEEDILGTQLFLVDSRTTFHNGGIFYHGGPRYWRSPSEAWSNTSGMTTFAAGNSTQNDMDIFGSVDTSGFLWFADWGHDDGGLFGVGNDSQLGTRPTNIKMVSDTYTN